MTAEGNKKTMLIIRSRIRDIYYNLAVEEYLLDRGDHEGPVLFLWQSDCAVVIGKNQNPWKECRLPLMEAEEVRLARRISGGGTVYHDSGNLNYCIVVDRADYCECQAYKMVMRSLECFGLEVRLSDKSNLCIGEHKFSGNAFCYRKNRVLHHGTLLVKSDLDRLGRYLGPSLRGIETRAVASRPATVMNLQDVAQSITVDELCGRLEESFLSDYADGKKAERMSEQDLTQKILMTGAERVASAEWLFNATPGFCFEGSDGRMRVEKGRVIEGGDAYIGRSLHDIFSLVS